MVMQHDSQLYCNKVQPIKTIEEIYILYMRYKAFRDIHSVYYSVTKGELGSVRIDSDDNIHLRNKAWSSDESFILDDEPPSYSLYNLILSYYDVIVNSPNRELTREEFLFYPNSFILLKTQS